MCRAPTAPRLRRVLSSTTDLRYLTFSPTARPWRSCATTATTTPNCSSSSTRTGATVVASAGPSGLLPQTGSCSRTTRFEVHGRDRAVHVRRAEDPRGLRVSRVLTERGLARFQDGDPLRDRDHAAAGAARRARRRAPTLAGHVRRPVWSPDGRWLAYLSPGCVFCDSRKARRAARKDLGVWIVHPDGSGLRRVGPADEEDGAVYSWSPDGSRLAIVAGSRLLVASSAGHARRIAGPPAQLGVVHGATLVARRHAAHLSGAHRARPDPALEPSRRRLRPATPDVRRGQRRRRAGRRPARPPRGSPARAQRARARPAVARHGEADRPSCR